ncbi:minor capsid protein [Enterococcus hailinensis]|uniref:minor capsid protein n=1 Tax=Enterococcus hailinensis TaxID=3238988 RepID=UPI0038B37243
MLHVKVEKNGVDRKLSVMNINSAMYYMTSQMHMDMNLYVPKRQGNLRHDSLVNRNHITYTAPYARAQFYGFINGKRIHKYTKEPGYPSKSRRWDLRAKANHMDAWRRAFIKGGNL